MTDTPSVQIALALGSNIGDRLAALRGAVRALQPYVEVTATSPVYETAAAYVADQPAFLNAAVIGTTRLEPLALLWTLKDIETEIGRTPTFHYGPRVIDIDIIFYGDRIVKTPELTIPHLRMAEREFVLRPLNSIAPNMQHPQSGRTVADMIDVGGESSRPGSVPVSAQEEIRRVVPVIAAIHEQFPALPIAVDTVKAEVADQALRAGAAIVNDISALSGDARMAEIILRHEASVVLMHNRSTPDAVNHDATTGGQYDAPEYDEIVEDVARDLAARVKAALAAGIARDKIILDPGIGFGKTPQQNIELIAHMYHFTALGFPVLMGASRKSFIGSLLGLPVDERLEGTAACVTACVLQGADIVRVHDVKFMARVVKMAALLRDA